MDSLPLIPAAPKLLWNQFRIRLLPLVMVMGLLSLAGVLWSRVNNGPSLAGIAEGVRVAVASPQPGRIAELSVRPYQLVNKGDPIAVIQPVDARLPLELLQTEIQLLQMRLEPSLAQQNAMDYQRLRVEMLRLKAELAVARIDLRRAENELKRNQALYREKLLSEDLYDLSLQTRDAVQAEVTEKERSVAEIQQRLEELRGLGDPNTVAVDEPLQRLMLHLEASHASASSNFGPMILVAPISGMVCPVLRQPGEFVLEGEPFVGIQSLGSDRVVAYLRQPYSVDPELGMPARVITRTRWREQYTLPIAAIGAQVENITNALAFIRQGALVDVGLPIVLELPSNNHIRPGELVDISLKPSASSGREPSSPSKL